MSNRKFYEYVNRGGGKKVITSLPGKIHKQFATDELDEMYDYIVEKGKDENVYINPNSRRADLPPGARGSDDDITSVIAFVADVVTASVGHIPSIITKVGFSLMIPLYILSTYLFILPTS